VRRRPRLREAQLSNHGFSDEANQRDRPGLKGRHDREMIIDFAQVPAPLQARRDENLPASCVFAFDCSKQTRAYLGRTSLHTLGSGVKRQA
jgi:hypothetical protein